MLDDSRLTLTIERMVGCSGDGAVIGHNRVQRVGLALAGHFHGVVPNRLQVCGETEISYLQTLTPEKRACALHDFLSLGVCAVFITGGLPMPSELVDTAEVKNCTVTTFIEPTGKVIQAIESYLDERLAPRTQLHGVLVDVFGVGILLLGKSGIGKSECALDLVHRGHRLVADDIVRCDYRQPGYVFGAPAGFLKHHIEVRGLGILNIKSLFGVTAVRDRKRIDVVVKLFAHQEEPEHDRLGIDDRYIDLLGAKVREVVLPVRAGRDMAAIIEIAARDELSRRAGHHSAKEFYDSIEHKLERERNAPDDQSHGSNTP